MVDGCLQEGRLLHGAPDASQRLYASAPWPVRGRSAVRHTAAESSVNMARRFCYSLYKLVGLRAFVKKRICAFGDVPLSVSWSGVAAEHDKCNMRGRQPDRAQNFQTLTTFKLDIQHHDVRRSRQNALNRCPWCPGLACHHEGVGFEHRGDAVPDQRRIVSEENPQGCLALRHGSTVAGTDAEDHRLRLNQPLGEVWIGGAAIPSAARNIPRAPGTPAGVTGC